MKQKSQSKFKKLTCIVLSAIFSITIAVPVMAEETENKPPTAPKEIRIKIRIKKKMNTLRVDK